MDGGRARRSWTDLAPGVAGMLRSSRSSLRRDVTAGLAMTALSIPHGMAYAELAGLPPVNGLYTTVLALAVYAVVGPSRILMTGPDSSLAPLIAAAIALVGADGDPGRAVGVAGLLALLTGAVCILAGVARLGTLAELLSRPVRVGFLNGLAVVMIVSQLPTLLGMTSQGGTAAAQFVGFVEDASDGLGDSTTLVLGLACLALLAVLRRWWSRLPAAFIVAVAATVTTRVLDLAERGVSVVGEVPSGLPRPDLPSIDGADAGALLLSSVAIAVLVLSDSTLLSKSLGAAGEAPADPNREIVALGATNVATGVFQGFPVSASTTRTSVARAAGGQSQLVGVTGALLVVAVLAFAGGLLDHLPDVALAAIVVGAAVELFDAKEMRWLFEVRRSEFFLAAAATIGVVAFGVLQGIGIAVALSLANFVRRAWRPYDAVLGRIEERKGYHDITRHPEARQIPGLLLFRFDAPLFFANIDHFGRRLRAAVAAASEPVRRVVIAAEPVVDIDTTGAEVLARLLDELDEAQITVSFAELKGPVKDRLRRYGLYERIGDRNFHSTLGTAIDAYLDETGVSWTDWTERSEPEDDRRP